MPSLVASAKQTVGAQTNVEDLLAVGGGVYEVTYVNGEREAFDATEGCEVGKNIVLRRKTADRVDEIARIPIVNVRMWGYRAERAGG
jgi:hypothetical protein